MRPYRNVILVIVLILMMAITGNVLLRSEDVLTLGTIRTHAGSLRSTAQQYGFGAGVVFVVVFVIVSSFLPGAALLTLLAGFLFGTLRATLYVDAATTGAAVLSFSISRNLCGKWVQKRHVMELRSLNRHIDEYGHLYLLMVRLVPMVPFFWVNLTAGLTRVRLRTFIWTTAVGSLPGILVFSYAGRRLLGIQSMEDVFTPDVIVSGILLMLLLGAALGVHLLLRRSAH